MTTTAFQLGGTPQAIKSKAIRLCGKEGGPCVKTMVILSLKGQGEFCRIGCRTVPRTLAMSLSFVELVFMTQVRSSPVESSVESCRVKLVSMEHRRFEAC